MSGRISWLFLLSFCRPPSPSINAVADADDSLGVLRHLRVVRHQDDGQPFRFVERAEHLQNLLAGARIQIARRFIGQQQPRAG